MRIAVVGAGRMGLPLACAFGKRGAQVTVSDVDRVLVEALQAGECPYQEPGLAELIVELRDSLGTTMVMVTHELPSIFAIADNSVYLDAETRTQLATGDPKALLRDPPDSKIGAFLTRGGKERR